MAIKQFHLELRTTGYYWRRRVPARAGSQFKSEFFCFPLRTHVPRDAAELARRLTAVSEICFHAEQDMPSDVITEILMAYVEGKIEVFDRLRALSGPRTREAAEAAMTDGGGRSGRTARRDLPARQDPRDPTASGYGSAPGYLP